MSFGICRRGPALSPQGSYSQVIHLRNLRAPIREPREFGVVAAAPRQVPFSKTFGARLDGIVLLRYVDQHVDQRADRGGLAAAHVVDLAGPALLGDVPVCADRVADVDEIAGADQVAQADHVVGWIAGNL